MNRIPRLLLMPIVALLVVFSSPISQSSEESPFSIRGTLPWHNFLSGPTAWNFDDYKEYLDWMAALNMNFVGFHCYTGGAERYVTYVEPLIRVEYRNVLPPAEFDTSVTARWGYRQLTTDRFAFGTRRFFKHKVFGADCAIKARDQEDRYERAQDLMRRVIAYAHKMGIKVCLGFEFGIYPPEFFSIAPPDALLRSPQLPDPTHPASIEILQLYLRNILSAYPDIDYIWFWLQEMFNPSGDFSFSPKFQRFFNENNHWFSYLDDDLMKFNGVWSLAYIAKARDMLKEMAPNVPMAISGWGGSNQLPALLEGLHNALPKDVIFSCLNPSQGWDPQREIMGQMEGRETWIIPWLEGDRRLWHPQPRVSLLAEQIALAKNQKIEGVIGIHWRTEDIRANFEALGLLCTSPSNVNGIRLMTNEEKSDVTSAFYQAWCEREYGPTAAKSIAPILTRFDVEQILAPRRGGVESPEYHPYHSGWGFLPPEVENEVRGFLDIVIKLRELEKEKSFRSHLDYLENTLRFCILLHETGIHLAPASELRDAILAGEIDAGDVEAIRNEAWNHWRQAPLEELFTTYGKRIRSRGELGVLSSLNQKLWLHAQELKQFLESKQ